MNSFELKKEIEQKLKESEEKFHLLFDTIPDALYIIDQETGKILDVNKAAEKMYGYSREEWLQMKNTDVSAEPDKTKKATNKLPSQIPIRYHKKKDGTIFPIEMMASSYTLNDQRLIIATGRDITERKKLAEEEIKKHREMIENLDIGYFSVNMEGIVTYANNAFKEIAGFSSIQELIGHQSPNFWVNPKDRQKYLKTLMTDGYIANYTVQAKRKNGERITVEVNAHLNRNANNEPIEIEGTFINTTERVLLEEKLLKREKSLTRAQEIAQLGFWDWNVITGELYWSDEIFRQHGFKPKEILPTFEVFASIVHPEDLEYVQKNVNAALEDNAEYDIDFRIKQPSGEIRYIYTKGEVTRDIKGKAIRFVGTQIDITERKLALRKLENSEKRLKFILSTNPAIIYISKASGDYEATFISENITAQTGYRAEDFTNNSQFWTDNLHLDDKDRVLSELSHLFEKGKHNHEYRFKYKDGTYHWMRDSMLLVYDEKGNPQEIIGSWIDITDSKNLEQKSLFHTKKIEILNKIILTANRAVNFNSMIQEAFELTLNLMDFDGGGVYIADYDKNIANLICFKNLPQDFVDAVKECRLDIDPYKTLFYKAEPIFSENWHLNDPVFAEKSGLLSLAVIPILSKEQVIGALNVASKRRYVFSEEEKDILVLIGHEIGIIISKMRMEEELKSHRDHLEILVKKRTSELEESEKRYRGLISNISDAILELNHEGKFLFASKQAKDIFGYEPDELLGIDALSFIHPEDVSIVVDAMKNAIETAESILMEFRNKHRDGYYVPVSLKGTSIKKDGNLIYIGVMRDDTKRKEAEKLINQEKKFSKGIIRGLPGIFYIVDAQTKLLMWNKNLELISGYDHEELNKMTRRELTPKDELKKVGRLVKEAYTKGAINADIGILTKEGVSIPYNFSARKIMVRGETYLMGLGIDISEKKRAEEELKKTMKDLKRSNSELEQFAYIASHDLQEPLRMVASFTQLLQKRYQDKLDDEANEFINFAVDGVTRMQGLINDLLDFSRIGTKGISFSPTDMNIILENVLTNIRQSTIEANAEITYDPLPVIIADGSQMIQILQNLISNAIKFRRESSIQIHVSGENKTDRWLFSVKDNGIGIEPKYFKSIFVIFQRLHKRDEYDGAGIGLAVCKKIIQRHRGKIWVESELGKGSTFHFSIPKKNIKKYESDE